MKNTALVIMAAGIGSRFGDGIKQLEPVGPNGETLMEYSIYDALEAGFNKVVFVIRKELLDDVKTMIGDKVAKIVPVYYAFQDLYDVPAGFTVPAGRVKPWGTGQAVLSAGSFLDEPFAVINADDYYGRESFCKLHDYLAEIESEYDSDSVDWCEICMAGFKLGNTLSENGGVTRGICTVGKDEQLEQVKETYGIERNGQLLTAKTQDGSLVTLDEEQIVSMNMWGMKTPFLKELDNFFFVFMKNEGQQSLTAEFLLPSIIDQMISEGCIKVKVLSTNEKWFGVTYQEDKKSVKDAVLGLVHSGIYKEKLY